MDRDKVIANINKLGAEITKKAEESVCIYAYTCTNPQDQIFIYTSEDGLDITGGQPTVKEGLSGFPDEGLLNIQADCEERLAQVDKYLASQKEEDRLWN